MTPRDTHELRLTKWPRLSTFPTTAGTSVSAIGLAWATWVGLMLGKVFPDVWYWFVLLLAGGAVTQFGIKRKTWDPKSPQNGEAGGGKA